MKIGIPYLDRILPLEFPEENLLAIAEPKDVTGVPSFSGAVLAEALERPYGITADGARRDGGEAGQSLAEFLEGGKRILVIINDATRPTPTAAMLAALMPAFRKAGVPNKSLTLLVATGAHRAPTEDEYRQILGGLYGELRGRAVHHDARKDGDMVELGNTRNGTPILLNRRIFEADRVIATGSVEPHYFAGFTGGRKAFLPGVAAYRSIAENHKRALSEAARSLALEGNPVHEDMMDALPLIKTPVFSLMAVLDKEQRTAAAASGDIMASFYAAVEKARQIFCVPVAAKADIVVSVAKFPMDIDLYQSQKAIDNGAAALKDGGVLILVSSCRDGIGDESYAKLLSQAASPVDAIDRIHAGYRLGYHKAAKMAAVSARATVMAVTELSPERLAGMFIESAASPQAALDNALARLREQGIMRPKILILPDGCVTVPDVNPQG
ncbi:MAG: nickel-dependent lactate racemase [Treponema sp.]|jgi:nickel-dependent lactate racemase|nr:nickel-dependent lactate racemase [Treponema sp.]